MSLKLKRPKTIVLKWDEKEQLWHRFMLFNTRRHAEIWLQKNVNNGCFLAVPNVSYILKSLEEGNYEGANSSFTINI